MIRVRSFAWLALLVALGGGVASAKVTGGAVMLDNLEVREAPSRDSAIVMTLRQGTQVLLSKAPSAPPGWLHVMVEDASAELRHGYVPLGTVGIMTLRTSSDAFAAAQDGAAFPAVRVVAELSTLKCKRLPRSLGRLESCVVHYAVHLAAPSNFNGHALTSCTAAIDFLAGEGTRATASEREQLQVLSTQAHSVEGSVEVAAPLGGTYDQAAFAGVQCRLEKVTTF
jgi:hypothetical protein